MDEYPLYYLQTLHDDQKADTLQYSLLQRFPEHQRDGHGFRFGQREVCRTKKYLRNTFLLPADFGSAASGEIEHDQTFSYQSPVAHTVKI